jgi:hypothetical protein
MHFSLLDTTCRLPINLGNTSNVTVPQPGFFSNTAGANVIPDMLATAHILSYREDYSAVCFILREI